MECVSLRGHVASENCMLSLCLQRRHRWVHVGMLGVWIQVASSRWSKETSWLRKHAGFHMSWVAWAPQFTFLRLIFTIYKVSISSTK